MQNVDKDHLEFHTDTSFEISYLFRLLYNPASLYGVLFSSRYHRFIVHIANTSPSSGQSLPQRTLIVHPDSRHTFQPHEGNSFCTKSRWHFIPHGLRKRVGLLHQCYLVLLEQNSSIETKPSKVCSFLHDFIQSLQSTRQLRCCCLGFLMNSDALGMRGYG